MAREVTAEKGHLDRKRTDRGNSDCKGPEVCVTSNTVYPAGLQGLAVLGEDRAGRGISSEVPRDACCFQAAGERGGAIVAQVTFHGSAVLYSLVSRGKWNLSGKRCLCDAALSFLPQPGSGPINLSTCLWMGANHVVSTTQLKAVKPCW